MNRLAVVTTVAALVLSACSHAPVGRSSRSEIGLASFYAKSLHGRLTASGARYDSRAMTCAHRRLPFGSTIRVTDLDTQRSVEVVVNDRGPFVRGRVVDLSLAAAEDLGIVERGVARVQIDPAD